eukprot:1893000-Prymnesium_polylepis.2
MRVRECGDIGELEHLRTENARLTLVNDKLKKQLTSFSTDARNNELKVQRKTIIRVLKLMHMDKHMMSQADAVAALVEMLKETERHTTHVEGSKKRRL